MVKANYQCNLSLFIIFFQNTASFVSIDMPLIIFTGLPASGKSTRAQQLRDYFSTTKKVTILSENDIAKKKNDIHAGTFMFYTWHVSNLKC